MDTPQIFQKAEFGSVRVIPDGDSFWVVGADVLRALEYAAGYDISRAFSSVPAEWKGLHPMKTPGGTQLMLCLSEQGLYFFLSRSDKPKALPYQMWLASDVVPSIRKTGMYAINFNDPLEAAKAFVAAEEARRAAVAQAQQAKAELVETRTLLGRVVDVANKLAADQGLAANYRKVKAIPWLKDYFYIEGEKSPFYGNCGKYMTMLSNQRGYQIEKVEDPDWGFVKAYTLDAWDYFKQLLDSRIINSSTKYIGKYLK